MFGFTELSPLKSWNAKKIIRRKFIQNSVWGYGQNEVSHTINQRWIFETSIESKNKIIQKSKDRIFFLYLAFNELFHVEMYCFMLSALKELISYRVQLHCNWT